MYNEDMAGLGKRTITISVKFSKEDLELMEMAAKKLWPSLPAPLTRSTMIWALALRAAHEAVSAHRDDFPILEEHEVQELVRSLGASASEEQILDAARELLKQKRQARRADEEVLKK